MRLQQIAPLVGLVASVQAGHDKWGTAPGTAPASTVWVTTVVPTYTTYCPSPTTWAYLNTTYTVTSETTITLPCPCTVSISSIPPVVTTSTFTTEVPCTTETPAPSSVVPYPSVNATLPITTVSYTASTGVTTITSVPPASTFVSGTTDLGGGSPTTLATAATTAAPTNIPVAPTTSPGVVTVNGAYKFGPGAGTLGFMAGLAALIL